MKNSKLNIKIFFLLFLVSTQSFLFCEESVEQVTIKADLNLQLDTKKPKIEISFDKNNILTKTVEVESEILTVSPESLDDILPAFPQIIFSKNTISPYLIDIITEPVLNFRMKTFPNFKVKKWKINITDAKGELFSTITGKNILPSIIPWNGRNNKYEMVIPGKWYSYNLLITDEFGDEYTIQGENFVFKGILYSKDKKDKVKIISLSLLDLFNIDGDKDSLEIKTDGQKLIKQALDIIKENYTKPMKIIVYDNKEQTGLKRGQKILQYILSNLYIQDIKINIQFVPSYISDYRVDIEIYNKK